MSKTNPVHEVSSESDPLELSAELTKFALENAPKDPSTLEAAVYVTAHNFVDEDGDDALNFAAVVGGNPNRVADLIIEVINTLVETRPLLAIKFHQALVKNIRNKVKAFESRVETGDNDDALANVINALENLRDSIKK